MKFLSLRLTSIAAAVFLLMPSFAHAATILYVTSKNDDSVFIINATTHATVGTVDVDTTPWGIAISGTGAYVANTGSHTVSVIDVTDNKLVTTIAVGSGPQGVAISGTGVYVTNSNASTVSVIDTTTNTVDRTISVGSGPWDIVISGTGAFVPNRFSNTVSVIDITTLTVDATVIVGNTPRGIAASGTGVYVAIGDDSVDVIDRTSNQVDVTFAVAGAPYGIGTSGTGVYVVRESDDAVSIFDTTDNQLVKAVSVGDAPAGIGFAGTGAFISNSSDDTVSVIDTTTFTVDATLTGFDEPFMFATTTDNTTIDPILTAPTTSSSVELCNDLTVTYTLPETPLSGSVKLQFYNTDTHGGPTLTLGNSTTASFAIDLENLTSAAQVSATDGDNALTTGSYVVYLKYRDVFGNSEADDSANITVSVCTASSSSSSSVSVSTGGGGGGGGGGGRPTITPEYIKEVSEKRFGSSSSSSSARPEFVEVNGQKFSDVRSDAWYGTFVKKIAELKIFEGYKLPDGTPLNKFGPADSITLGQLAKVGTILWNKKDIEPKPTGNEWFKPYIASAETLNFSVFKSKPSPLAHATRAQVVQTIIEALAYPLRDGESPYADVPSTHPNAKAIITATQLGFIGGDAGTSNFRPDEPINRAEVAKVLSLALGHVGINYLDDMLAASPTSSSSAATASSSASSISSSASSSSISSEALKSAAEKDIRHVITPNAHVRSDARINSTILWTAKFGQEFEVLRIVAGSWAHVRVSDGNEGYVFMVSLSK